MHVVVLGAGGPAADAGPVTLAVPKPGSTTVVNNTPNPSVVGQDVTFTATVSAVLAAGTPTGSVTFTVNGVPTAVPLDALGSATYSTATLAAGTYTVTADYGGDTIFLPSTATTTQTVNKAASSTALVSDINPSIVGGNVTFNATVSPFATGTVQFTIDGASAGAPVSLVAGQASLSISTLTVGAHLVSATYSGDTAYLSSTSPTITQSVGPALRATSTVVTSSRTPASTYGQSITFTATVRPSTGTGIPTGTVQFNIDGVNVGGILTLNAQGRATYSTATLTAGLHTIIATYSGSAIFAGGGSAAFTQIVNQAVSATVLTSNVNPSVSGQTVTFTARVTPLAATGTVQFRINGVDVGGPVTLDATGRARLTTNALAVGTTSVSAIYAGNLNYQPSASANLTQTVNKATSRTVVVSSGTPATRGTTVVFTVTVTARAPGAGTPTGTARRKIAGARVRSPAPHHPSGTRRHSAGPASRGAAATSVAGSAGEGVPSVYWVELEARLESVRPSVDVNVSVFWLVPPSVTVPNARAEPVSGGVTGEPKAETLPSRLPTYRRPAPTPGVA